MAEKRIVLRNCGIVDPANISSTLKKDGFAAFKKARDTMSPDEIIDEIKASGLTGRGGAGFSCGTSFRQRSCT